MKRWPLALGLVFVVCVGALLLLAPPPMELDSDQDWVDQVLVPEGPAVQLHLSAVPFSGQRAVHPFFLVRDSDQEIHRYEVWQSAGVQGSHLWVDENSPWFTMGTGTVLWGQVQGQEALSVIEVLRSGYPCADRYTMLPGPNSNTYAAWVLEQSGWAVALPEQSLGQSWGCQ